MPTFTVSFCGTACSRDEGERDRSRPYKLNSKTHVVSHKDIFDGATGYIPVRIHRDISGTLEATDSSATVRGPGENDWANQMDESDLLNRNLLLDVPEALLNYVKPYSDGSDQYTLSSQAGGWGAVALALHGANLAAAAVKKGAESVNFLGHSRGAVASIMAAWFLYAYGGRYRQTPISIFGIDPVPGIGEWYGILTQLPPNVRNYVGVYAWDHLNTGFAALVPRPNFQMTGVDAHHLIETRKLGSAWDTLADNCQLDDPLAPNKNNLNQPTGYHLYACRGKHGTVAGIATSDGLYDPAKRSPLVAPVPRLVYKLARAYLTQWGTVFQTRCRVAEDAKTLRRDIHSARTALDAMGGGETRTSRLSGRRFVRRISSIRGRISTDTYYLEDVVGDPPYRLGYPCTIDRRGGGWVDWKFL